MSDTAVISRIRAELERNVDPVYREGARKYFKDGIKLHGVRGPVLSGIAADHYALIKRQPKAEIFALCEKLFQCGQSEETSIALNWAWRLRRKLEPSDFPLLERWLKTYIDGWGSCDGFCTKAFGHFLLSYPQYLPKLEQWARSKNKWLRRASAVVLILPVRQRKYLPEVFKIADLLLEDKEDLVQKGYGWMLKEASNRSPDEVFAYVMEHKARMPRTALRYAIEKMPPARKKQAMAK